MTDENREKLHSIANHYGCKQLGILQEECAELIQAVSKLNRADGWENKKAAQENVAKEIADVLIMCEQVAYLKGIGRDVDRIICEKIDRQLKRIGEGR